MKAFLSTALVGFIAACSQQQPANSAATQASNEPVATSTNTNATGDSRAMTTTTRAAPPEPGREAAERENAVATPGAGKSTPTTQVDRRDDVAVRDDRAPTAQDQGESDGDRATTQQIRKAVMADDSLSFAAKNVTIITLNGKVTLRGRVNSARERAAVEAAARRAAGANSVDDQLEVKP